MDGWSQCLFGNLVWKAISKARAKRHPSKDVIVEIEITDRQIEHFVMFSILRKLLWVPPHAGNLQSTFYLEQLLEILAVWNFFRSIFVSNGFLFIPTFSYFPTARYTKA